MFTFYVDPDGYPWWGSADYANYESAREIRVPEDVNAALGLWKNTTRGRPESTGLACTFWVNVGRDRISGSVNVVDAMICEMGGGAGVITYWIGPDGWPWERPEWVADYLMLRLSPPGGDIVNRMKREYHARIVPSQAGMFWLRRAEYDGPEEAFDRVVGFFLGVMLGH